MKIKYQEKRFLNYAKRILKLLLPSATATAKAATAVSITIAAANATAKGTWSWIFNRYAS
jgi:hypothetical protein